MMNPWIAAVALAVLLQGCGPAALVYGESRKVNRGIIAPIMTEDRPGVANEPATTCILKGMTVSEVLSLPNSAMAKEPDTLRGFVRQVAVRPGVAECLATAPKVAG